MWNFLSIKLTFFYCLENYIEWTKNLWMFQNWLASLSYMIECIHCSISCPVPQKDCLSTASARSASVFRGVGSCSTGNQGKCWYHAASSEWANCSLTVYAFAMPRHSVRVVCALAPWASGSCFVTLSEWFVLRHPERVVRAPLPWASGSCNNTWFPSRLQNNVF